MRYSPTDIGQIRPMSDIDEISPRPTVDISEGFIQFRNLCLLSARFGGAYFAGLFPIIEGPAPASFIIYI